MGNFWEIVVVILVLLVSTVLHELAHGATAYLLGDDTAKEDGRLSLNPIRHIDPVMSIALPLVSVLTRGMVIGGAKPVPVNSEKLRGKEWGMALVAVAGPLTNFLIATLFWVTGHLFGVLSVRATSSGLLWGTEGFLGTVLLDGVLVNLGMMIFNLIPFPPLDGSRVLYALAPDGARRFMAEFERYGVFIVLLLVYAFSGVIGNALWGAIEGMTRFLMLLTGGA